MIFKTIVVLGISRKTLVASKIRLRSKKILKAYEYQWDNEGLVSVLGKVKNTFKVSKVRLLIADELSYTMILKVPDNLEGEEERVVIFKKLKQEIPENLDDSEWDFKDVRIVKTNGKEGIKEVFVFAPVKDFMQKLEKSFQEAGLIVEAIEPSVFASTRHVNPLVGLALKKDIQGKDKDVLNLEFDKNFSKKKDQNEFSQASVNSKSGERFLKTILAIFIILIAVVFSIYLLITKNFVKLGNLKLQRLKVSETPMPTTSFPGQNRKIISEPEIVDDTDIYNFSINILRGSQNVDVEQIKSLLEINGFSNVTLGDADSFEFQNTIVKTKENIPESTLGEIRNSLREYEVTFPSTYLEESTDYDIEITVGIKKSE